MAVHARGFHVICIPVPLSLNGTGCALFQARSGQPCWAAITDDRGNRSHFNSRNRDSATKLKPICSFLSWTENLVTDLCTLWRRYPYSRPHRSFTHVHALTLSLHLCRFCPPFINTCYDVVYKIIQKLRPVWTRSARALFVFSVATILR